MKCVFSSKNVSLLGVISDVLFTRFSVLPCIFGNVPRCKGDTGSEMVGLLGPEKKMDPFWFYLWNRL